MGKYASLLPVSMEDSMDAYICPALSRSHKISLEFSLFLQHSTQLFTKKKPIPSPLEKGFFYRLFLFYHTLSINSMIVYLVFRDF